MQLKYSRPLAVVVLAMIVIYGILRIWVLRVYAQLLTWLADLVGLGDNALFEVIKNQASKEEFQEQTLGWLIYYPTYFLLHIAFIYVLFANSPRTRNYLMLGLTALISMIIGCWLMFIWLELPNLAYIARKQFRNLFGLPFILLAIEGGRILYKDMVRLLKE